MQKKLKQEANKTVDIRQRLLQKEFEDLKHLPNGCTVQFDNPDILSQFKVIICPDTDSFWYGGMFEFAIQVPESYNFEVNVFNCQTISKKIKINSFVTFL